MWFGKTEMFVDIHGQVVRAFIIIFSSSQEWVGAAGARIAAVQHQCAIQCVCQVLLSPSLSGWRPWPHHPLASSQQGQSSQTGGRDRWMFDALLFNTLPALRMSRDVAGKVLSICLWDAAWLLAWNPTFYVKHFPDSIFGLLSLLFRLIVGGSCIRNIKLLAMAAARLAFDWKMSSSEYSSTSREC